jgi:hypothetical protein
MPRELFLTSVLCLGLLSACGSDAEGADSGVDAAVDAMDAGEVPHDAAAARDAGYDAASHDAGLASDAGEGCRSSGECSGETLCLGPDERLCGIPPREECQSDEECGDAVCHALADSCSPDGVGAICGLACTADSCGEGFVCTESGRCLPAPCGDAFACSPAETCDPASIDTSAPPHAVTHGCVAIACENDDPCPGDTVCVNGRCQTGFGACSLPPP